MSSETHESLMPRYLFESSFGPAHQILVLITSKSNDGSWESAHVLIHQSLCCSHTYSVDVDEDGPKIRPLANSHAE